GGGAAAVDHVDDAAAAGPTAIDSDGDGVPDYRDIDPQNSSVIGPPPAAGVSYANYWTRWSFSGMGLDTMNDTTYTSFVIPFKKPTLAGNVDWLTYTVDTDPTHSTTGAGTAVNTLRATCRLLGVALVAFWTVHGVLITIRQW